MTPLSRQSAMGRSRWLVATHLLGAVLCAFIILWWGSLILSKSARIAELERAPDDLTRTRRMLFWEGGAFLTLIVGGTAGLLWLDRRDAKRARSLQAFFASVTHELRTPLTSIRLQAESISDAVADSERKTMIQRLLEDTSRLQSQVERTLELARVEGGGKVLNQPLRIKPWMERMRRSWSSESPTSRIDFELAIPDEDLLVEADPSALQVILRNLLENSLRHGGKESLKVRIAADRTDDKVALVVQDDGRGCPEGHSSLGQIFEKGKNSQGAGVGLYLVRMLMKRMGGSAEFSSPTGRGFRTELSFKLATDWEERA